MRSVGYRPADHNAESQGRYPLIVSCIAVVLVIAAMSSLNIALTDIGRDTGATQTQLTWVLDAYTLALACLLLPFGALGDRFGRQRLLVLGSVISALASVAPVFSSSIDVLISCRALSGTGAAMVMPATLAIITGSHSQETRSRAIGIWAACASGGGIVGFVGSGVILQVGSWHDVLAASALAAGVVAIAALFLHESRDPRPAHLDPIGSVLSVVAIGVIVYGIVEAPDHGWGSAQAIVLWGIGGAAAVAFCGWQLRVADPLLDVRLFANRTFSAGSLSLVVQFLAGFGVMYLLLQYMRLLLGFGPLLSGVGLGPLAIPLFLLCVAAPRLVGRFGFRLVTGAGFASLAIGAFLFAGVSAGDHYPHLVPALFFIGVGIGLTAAPATSAIVDAVPASKQGVASAVNDAAREIGAALGIALVGSVLATGYRDSIRSSVGVLPHALAARLIAAPTGLLESAGRTPALRPLLPAARHSYVVGQQSSAVTLGVVMLAAAIAVPLLAPRGAGRTATDPVREQVTAG